MRSRFRGVLLTIILFMGCSVCNTGDVSIDKSDSSFDYEGFEGYTFILDEGGFRPGKLYALSPEGELCNILEKVGGNIQLSPNSLLQKSGDYLIVYSKSDRKTSVTVINAKTLELVSQVPYNFKDGWTPDYIEAISGEEAIIASDEYELYSLDLRSGEIKLITDRVIYNGWAYAVSYEGLLFMCCNEKEENGLKIFNPENPEETIVISTPKRVRKLDQLNETMLLARTYSDESYVVSMKSRQIIQQVFLDIPVDLPRHSIIGDIDVSHIFYAGKDLDKNKIYVYDLSTNHPIKQLFYTIPITDINMANPISGTIRMCINPDMQEFYVAHINDLDPYRASRDGFISSISMKGVYDRIPIREPDHKTWIQDLEVFTPFFFYGKGEDIV